MTSDTVDELVKIEQKRKWVESWVFFRLAATSASAGVFLVITTSEGITLPWIGFFLFCFSIVCLIAELVRFSKRCQKIIECVSLSGDMLVPIFMLVSIVTIIINWSKIIHLVNNVSCIDTLLSSSWITTFFSLALSPWFIIFLLILAFSVIRGLVIQMANKKGSILQIIKKIAAMVILMSVVISASYIQLSDINRKDIWVLLVIILPFIPVYFLLRKKNKNNHIKK